MHGTSLQFALSLLSTIVASGNLQTNAAAPPEMVNFLELGSKGDQSEEKKCPSNVPSWECDAPPVAPQKATMPAMPPAGPKIPRVFKCWISCQYGGPFNFNSTLPKKKSAAVGETALFQTGAGAAPTNDQLQTLYVDTSRRSYSSFMEVGPVGPGEAPNDADKSKTSLSNPFNCKTTCQFARQPVCNPIYNFRLGAAGMRPDEKECCMQCDKLCNKKQVLWQYRVCVHGCRAFCPFKIGHWSTWET